MSLYHTAGLLAGAALLLSACGGDPASDTSAAGSPVAAPSTSAPSVASPAPSPPANPATPATSATSASTTPARYTFPVSGKVSYGRTHHDYPATDIIAACGLPVRAPVAGTVLEVSRVDTFDKATSKGEDRGGLSVSLLGVDGVRYYGSHLSAIAAGIDAGVAVQSGTQLGLVGKTGNANNTCHLHFGISPPCARTGDWWIRRGVLYPWKYLDAWKAGRQSSPATEIAQWHRAHGCPKQP